MKNVNVLVSMEGTVSVVGINKGNKVSKEQYEVLIVDGLRELIQHYYEKGIARGLEQAKQSVTQMKEEVKVNNQPKQEKKPVQPTVSVKPKAQANVNTENKKFTNFRVSDDKRVVSFLVDGKQTMHIGFAKDRNAFIESYTVDGLPVMKETTKQAVINRLAKYQGTDARKLTTIINSLKPVTMAAASCACGAGINARVKEYSERNFGMVLCRDCQTNIRVNKPVESQIVKADDVLEEARALASANRTAEDMAYDVVNGLREAIMAEDSSCEVCLVMDVLPGKKHCAACLEEGRVQAADVCVQCGKNETLPWDNKCSDCRYEEPKTSLQPTAEPSVTVSADELKTLVAGDIIRA